MHLLYWLSDFIIPIVEYLIGVIDCWEHDWKTALVFIAPLGEIFFQLKGSLSKKLLKVLKKYFFIFCTF